MKALAIFTFVVLSHPLFSQELPCKEKFYNDRCKQRYQEDPQGQIHGKFIEYNEDGSVNKIAFYSHGKLHGTMTEYYGWGKIVTTYQNGVENGPFEKVETNGNVIEKGNYTNGVKTGFWIEYTYDKGNYVNGKKNGKWEMYQKGWDCNCDGGMITAYFLNDEPTGTWENTVVIGTKTSSLDLHGTKTIAFPATGGYTELNYYYKPGYKAVFKDGYYVEAYDTNGNPIKKQ